jgi:hypothetical protein
MPRPILPHIIRQHVEMAAHLWNVYDYHLLNPDVNPDMDEERLARLVENLEAHLDGLVVAGEAAHAIAAEYYEEYPEAGELFVVQVLKTKKRPIIVAELPIEKIREWLSRNVPVSSE